MFLKTPQSWPVRRRPGVLLALGLAVLLALGGLLWWSSAHAAGRFVYLHPARPMPAAGAGPVVFRLRGAGGERGLTLAQLRSLPAVRYSARQSQLGRPYHYTGVPLRDLAALAGVAGQDVRVGASDQFAATIKAADYQHYPVMLAYAEDDAPVSVAHKGPLLVVFPNQQYARRFPKLRYGSQWVWYAESLAAAP